MEAVFLSEAVLSQSPGCPQFSRKPAKREGYRMPSRGIGGFHLALPQTLPTFPRR
jgi:hypothetical protein